MKKSKTMKLRAKGKGWLPLLLGLFLAVLPLLPRCSSPYTSWNPRSPSKSLDTRSKILHQLFPPSNFLSGWVREGESQILSGVDLNAYLGKEENRFLQYQPLAAALQTFVYGERKVSVAIFDMGEIRNSFGAFSSVRGGSGMHFNIGKGGVFEKGKLLFWEGPYVVKIQPKSPGNQLKNKITLLGRTVERNILGYVNKDILPPLTHYLPEKGRLRYTAIYFRSALPGGILSENLEENDLGLNQRTEGIVASYRREEEPLLLMLIRYPSSRSALRAFSALRGQNKEGEEAKPLQDANVESFFSPCSGNKRNYSLFFSREKFLGGILNISHAEAGKALAKELAFLIGSGE